MLVLENLENILTVSKPAVLEERNGEIECRVVNNDGSRESTIILTGLKCLFQKQLPKMPKEYIARLVYDRNSHISRHCQNASRGYWGNINPRIPNPQVC